MCFEAFSESEIYLKERLFPTSWKKHVEVWLMQLADPRSFDSRNLPQSKPKNINFYNAIDLPLGTWVLSISSAICFVASIGRIKELMGSSN